MYLEINKKLFSRSLARYSSDSSDDEMDYASPDVPRASENNFYQKSKEN